MSVRAMEVARKGMGVEKSHSQFRGVKVLIW